MSPESSATDHENSQTPFAAPLARSVLARTSWVQHALSPWIRRWLAAGTLGRGPGRSAALGQQPWLQRETALAVANTQWLVKRVQRIAERQTLPAWAGAAPATELPLAGTRPAPVTAEPTLEPAPDTPGFKPFDSFTDFVKAVEESRVREYQPSRPVSNLAPETQHERARQPKLSASARQLPPSREQGPYSRRFASFADFVQALEETRQRESQLAAQAAPQPPAQDEAHGAPAPATRIRPVSSIEELPPHISTVPEQAPAPGTAAELSLPMQPAPDESAQAAPLLTQPAELVEHYPAAEPSLDIAIEAQGEISLPAARLDQSTVQVTSKEGTTMPRAVQPHPRTESPSPTERAAEAVPSSQPGLAAPHAPVMPPAPTPTTPPVQRRAIEVEPATAAGAPYVMPPASAPIEPEIGAEPIRPETRVDAQRDEAVQPQAAATEPARQPSPATELPIEPPPPRGETPPTRSDLPVAQRQAIEPARPHVEPPPIRRETPHVVAPSEQQATGAGPVPRPSAATEPHAATTGTQTPEPMEPPVEAPRPTPRHVPLAPERQAAEAEPAEPSVEPQPIPHETPPSAVQRRAAEAKLIEPRSEPSVKPSLPRSTTPQPVRPDARFERPVVQRQATQPAPPPSVSVEPQAEEQMPASIEPTVETPATQVQAPPLPLKEVQRQVAETKPVPPPEAMVEPSIEPQPIRREAALASPGSWSAREIPRVSRLLS